MKQNYTVILMQNNSFYR